jgi:catechol 2,3-dioxygenase-like lactoylglutathione lyase family enzyme
VPRNDLRFRYTGIEVRNLTRSIRFYRGLGFRIIARGRMGHGGEWVHLRLPRQSQRLELNYYPRGNRFHRPYRSGSELDHIGFRVEDADAWARRAVRLGAKPADRVDEEHEWLVYVTDPDGIWLEFIGTPSVRDRNRKGRRSR